MQAKPAALPASVTCPQCAGHKTYLAVTVHYSKRVPCPVCRGRGTISTAQSEAIRRGKAMRADRVARHVSQREEAHRLGIHPRGLNDMEWGRAPISAYPEVTHAG